MQNYQVGHRETQSPNHSQILFKNAKMPKDPSLQLILPPIHCGTCAVTSVISEHYNWLVFTYLRWSAPYKYAYCYYYYCQAIQVCCSPRVELSMSRLSATSDDRRTVSSYKAITRITSSFAFRISAGQTTTWSLTHNQKNQWHTVNDTWSMTHSQWHTELNVAMLGWLKAKSHVLEFHCS